MKYATKIEWDNEREAHVVRLTRDDVEVVVMPLDDWAELGAVKFLTEDTARQAVHEAVTPPDDDSKRLWDMNLAELAALADTAAGAAEPPTPRD